MVFSYCPWLHLAFARHEDGFGDVDVPLLDCLRAQVWRRPSMFLSFPFYAVLLFALRSILCSLGTLQQTGAAVATFPAFSALLCEGKRQHLSSGGIPWACLDGDEGWVVGLSATFPLYQGISRLPALNVRCLTLGVCGDSSSCGSDSSSSKCRLKDPRPESGRHLVSASSYCSILQ